MRLPLTIKPWRCLNLRARFTGTLEWILTRPQKIRVSFPHHVHLGAAICSDLPSVSADGKPVCRFVFHPRRSVSRPAHRRIAVGKSFTLLNRYFAARMCMAVILAAGHAFFACFSCHLGSPPSLRSSHCWSNTSVLKKSRRLVKTILQPQIADSSSTNAVNFSSARTMKRFPSSRCASITTIVRPSLSDFSPPATNVNIGTKGMCSCSPKISDSNCSVSIGNS
jgi:hypothetical protein